MDSKGKRATDPNMWKWRAIYLALSFLVGGGISAGGLQVFSPTNMQVQEQVNLLEQSHVEYVESHEKVENLKDDNIALELSYIKKSIERIEEQQKTLESLIRNGH